MASYVFVADNTIPGLGASDLARFALAARGFAANGKLRALKQALRGADVELLRDLGVDRDAC